MKTKRRIRKFYLRSKLNFGRHSGHTVEEVLHFDDGCSYIDWCSENMPKICFADEVFAAMQGYYKEKMDEEDYQYAMDCAESGWDGHK